jgi:ubiquinone/menaquinone biosynthesis C-methylase UbiE
MTQPSNKDYVPALSFHWLTPYYDAVVGTTTRERAFKQVLIRQAGCKAGQQVLDLACGTGTLAIWIKQSQPLATVTGVDGDPAILSIATRKAQRADVAVQFDHALSYHLPYPAAHFDRAVSSLFFHHLTWENKQRTAQELFRVLKPGGQLHVADWGYPANALMRGLFLSVQLLDGFKNTQDNASGKLIELFQQAGFSAVAQRQTFSTVYGTMALYSAIKHGESDGELGL